MRVPFIAAWARPDADNPYQKRLPIPAGALQGQMGAVYDLFPTIVGLTGADAPADHVLDGSRLDTLLTGKPDPSRDEVFLMHYPHSPHRSNYFTVYRDGDWKVIYHYFPSEASENSHYQLYNLADDPFESTNLAPTHPKELARMMKGLIAAMESENALYPVDKQDGKTPLKPQMPE